MSKITRRSYKRKKIVMGVALFGAIALVSTGFAAWVLSASATEQQEAKLNVGTVNDNNMKFQNVKIFGIDTDLEHEGSTLGEEIEVNTYSFNPQYTDNSGRVRFGQKDDSHDVGERMSLTVKGEVDQAQNMGSLKVKLDEVPAELTEAVTKGYVKLPACAAGEQAVEYTLSGSAVKVASFSYTIAFTWGDTFGGVNPGLYYDNAGSSISIVDVKETLEDLHSLLDQVTITATFTAMPN